MIIMVSGLGTIPIRNIKPNISPIQKITTT
jgi:hypothetical protein